MTHRVGKTNPETSSHLATETWRGTNKHHMLYLTRHNALELNRRQQTRVCSMASRTGMRWPSLGASSPFVELHLKEGDDSSAPRATDCWGCSVSTGTVLHQCCAAPTAWGKQSQSSYNLTALLLAAATPEGKDGQPPRVPPFFSCAVVTHRANLSCQTQWQADRIGAT